MTIDRAALAAAVRRLDLEDLASRRDDVQNELVQNWGFASLSTDQEEGSEAEAHLKGAKHTIDVQVVPLCKGKLRIRYTVQ